MIRTEEELEELLSRPTTGVSETMGRLKGDLVVLGAGGKMGPTLARMAKRAAPSRGVVAVARFTSPRSRKTLEDAGVRTVPCDLLDGEAVRRLPDAAAVIFMAGQKFGTTGQEAATWATNSYLPGLVAERYRGAPTVVFSTGNVYPLMLVSSGGATEETPPAPIGEYAQSCLARERVFEHFSRRYGTPTAIFRLNYAVELRYGILLDLAQKVAAGTAIDLSMGHVNVLWQGDANAMALRSLDLAASPPAVINVTGPETLRVRDLAVRLGELLGRAPILQGRESETALLSNASKAIARFGPPAVPVERLIEWVADWVKGGGAVLGKPTHFDVRDGKF